MLTKIEDFVQQYREEIVLFIGVVLIVLLSFTAGYVTAKLQEKAPLQIEQAP